MTWSQVDANAGRALARSAERGESQTAGREDWVKDRAETTAADGDLRLTGTRPQIGDVARYTAQISQRNAPRVAARRRASA